MDLELIRQELKKLLQEKLSPVALECDLKGVFPIEAYHAIADAGFGAIYLPKEYGGMESLEGLCLLMEEMSRISPGFALSTTASFQLYGYNVSHLGDKEQKERFLRPLTEKRKIGCWALTEPDVGSDAARIKTSAKRDGEHYVLNGSKTFITNAPIADFFLVIANTGGEGIHAASTFVLERGMPGLSTSQPFEKHGHRSSPTGQIFMDHVNVPVQNRLGREGNGFSDMKHSLEIERFMVAPMVQGMLETLIEKCVTYASGRAQFGQPILTYQLIQEKIARMKMHLELIRAGMEKGIRLIGQGQSLKNLATALKLYAGKMAVDMCSEAMQVFGGNGYMHEYGVEMFMRDAKLLEIGGGTNEMMLQILAKEAIKKYIH